MDNASDVNAPLAPIENAEFMRDAIGLAFDGARKRLFYSDIQKVGGSWEVIMWFLGLRARELHENSLHES